MGITSKLFLAALGLLALAGCGLTVWLWPRLAGSGPRPVAGRIGLLLGTQLVVLLTVAALANDLFGFYTSWSDLFGVGSQRYQLKDSGAVQQGVNASQLQGNSTAKPAAQKSATAGSGKPTSVTTTLIGLRSGITAGLQVFLPPEYYAPADSRRYYPAIVVDDTADPGVATLASDLMSGKQPLPQAVIVIVHGDQHHRIPCVDEPDAPSAEQFWGQDLRTAIADSYRVRLSPAAWGVMGSGPGGAGDCAVALALEDAGRYSAAAVIGRWQRAGAPNSPADPAWWLRNYPAPPSRLLFAATGESPQAILGPVQPPLQVSSSPGPANDYSTLQWLAQTLRNGAPQS
jgi:hypothetical protein